MGSRLQAQKWADILRAVQAPVGDDTVRQELDRVLSSAGFSKNERLSRFLRFVVERHLEGRDGDLKESVVGIEVFGRKPGFDPKVDGIVRTEAIRLRARLDKYYASEGAGNPLIIELPKGGYRPVFRERTVEHDARSGGSSQAWRVRAAWVAILVLLATGTGTIWWWRLAPIPVAVAVLPFENLSRDPARDYVADGLTDQVLGSLALIEGLTVPSRTSSFALRGTSASAAQAGSRLRADYLVEGSVLQMEDRVRVNVALVRVRDELRVWSSRFDRELTNVLTIHDEISQGIVDTLRLKISPGRRQYEANLEAYALYLRARQIMASFPTQGRPLAELALHYYEQAIATDVTYALAHAGMADAYLAIERNIGVAPRLGPDLLGRAKSAAARALELDPMVSEAHSAIGSIHAREYDWAEAERSLRRAIQLNPNNALAHLEIGFQVLLMTGRIEEGLAEVRRAVRLDPLSPYLNTEYGRALFWASHYDAAINQLREAIALDPSRARAYGALARALSAQDRTADAVAVFDDAVRRGALLPGQANAELTCVAARAARHDDVVGMLQRQLTNPVANISARVYACLGEAPQALERLEAALTAHEPNLAEILQAPDLAWMRPHPRVVSLRQQLNLP